MKPLRMISQCLFITICLLSTTKLSAQSYSKLLSLYEKEIKSQNLEKALSYAEKAEKLNNLTTDQKDIVQVMKVMAVYQILTTKYPEYKKSYSKQQRKYVEIGLQCSKKLSESQPSNEGYRDFGEYFKKIEVGLDLRDYDPKKEEAALAKKYKVGDKVNAYLEGGTKWVMIIQLMPPLAKVQISGTSETRFVRLTDLQ
ncbi:MAG: hypothetical protein ACOVSW_12590 [Candidatus Kapaibacteriota bacterium]